MPASRPSYRVSHARLKQAHQEPLVDYADGVRVWGIKPPDRDRANATRDGRIGRRVRHSISDVHGAMMMPARSGVIRAHWQVTEPSRELGD